MKIDCDTYFNSSTAIRIWRENDAAGEQRMFSCLCEVHKEDYFRKVIFSGGRIDEASCRDLAEDAFLATWETFNQHGKASRLDFQQPAYTGYFYVAFKRNYLKMLGKELKKMSAEKAFVRAGEQSTLPFAEGNEALRAKVMKTMDKMSPDCRKLLEWKHIRGLSHDEIAQRKQITRVSSIRMVSRCAMRFIKLWNQPGN
jgi:DNA-directed RNA polymerase specialized sigma24 family protein